MMINLDDLRAKAHSSMTLESESGTRTLAFIAIAERLERIAEALENPPNWPIENATDSSITGSTESEDVPGSEAWIVSQERKGLR